MTNAVSRGPERHPHFEYDANGIFQRGILSQRQGDAYANPFGRGGIPLDSLRFPTRSGYRRRKISRSNIKWNITDRFRNQLRERRKINSDLTRDSVFAARCRPGRTLIWTLPGSVPKVQFLAPVGSPADYFSSGLNSYYWSDSTAARKTRANSAACASMQNMTSAMTVSSKPHGLGRALAERDRTTRNTNFSTWGNLSAPWAGRAGCAPWGEGGGCDPNAPGGACPIPILIPIGVSPDQNTNGFVAGSLFHWVCRAKNSLAGGAFVDEFPDFAPYGTPFGANFQRGKRAASDREWRGMVFRRR